MLINQKAPLKLAFIVCRSVQLCQVRWSNITTVRYWIQSKLVVYDEESKPIFSNHQVQLDLSVSIDSARLTFDVQTLQ